MRAFTVLLLLSAGVCLALAEDLSTSSFGYGVNDPATGDVKDQQEVRIGDSVSGYYRTLDADGLLRTVNYKADDLNGFTADVKRDPIVVPPIQNYPSVEPIDLAPAVSPAPAFDSPDPIYYGPAAPAPVFNSPGPIYYGPDAPAPVFKSPEPVYYGSAPVYHSAEPIGYQPQTPIIYRSYSPIVYKSPEPTIIQQLVPPTIVKTAVPPTPIYTVYRRPSLSALIKSKFNRHPIVSKLKKVGSYFTKKH